MAMDSYDDLQQSFGRCLRQSGFIEKFYERFLASDPRIAQMFAKTDFGKQRLALRRGISMAILYAGGQAIVDRPMSEMADVHSRKGRVPVAPGLYTKWVDCLLDCIEGADPKVDAALLRRWREAMEKVTGMFAQHY